LISKLDGAPSFLVPSIVAENREMPAKRYVLAAPIDPIRTFGKDRIAKIIQAETRK